MSYWTLAGLLLLGYLALLPCMLALGWRFGWLGVSAALALGAVVTGLLWVGRPPHQDVADLAGTFALVTVPLVVFALVGVAVRKRGRHGAEP
jgi:hypothetical protein